MNFRIADFCRARTQSIGLLGVAIACLLFTTNRSCKSQDGEEVATSDNRPVKVYILSGQSNMVGIGQVSGGTVRWSGITEATVSVYEGEYSSEIDYDNATPTTTVDLPVYGGVEPTPFPGGGVQIARGFIEIENSGIYKFSPGYSNSTFNIMELGGIEVYRREVGGRTIQMPFEIKGGQKYPFKITFLTDAADGLGWWQRTDIPGTLETLVKSEGQFPRLLDEDGDWKVRDDVWYKGVVTATANKWLSIGCGANGNQIGPELGFGFVMGDHHDQPVLIIKSSQGNRSLGWDFLPPGSEQYSYEGRTYAGYKDTPESWVEGESKREVNWYAGKQYDDCFVAVHELLGDFDRNFPQFAGRGYEIAGFVWWQGHKDGGNDAHANRYEQNLVRLIESLRSEFNAADAPFVLATIGFDGWNMTGNQKVVAEAQLAVSGDKGKYQGFAGNVLTVETRDFWREAPVSPRDQGFHYNGNAETYMLVGEAIANGMLQLLESKN